MEDAILVTGGAGFIGSCYVLQAIASGKLVINLDKLTYAGNKENLISIRNNPRYIFIKGDIGNSELIAWILSNYKPQAIVNFAAETHVDRSIIDPEIFIRTNVLGTGTLLRVALQWWKSLDENEQSLFRFLHVSTDEVFGSLKLEDSAFSETTPYSPNSPYSASKAASDHLVRAFHKTYGLPVLLTNCSNNYGPRQFPEKLIPLMILNALNGKNLPIYGSGCNIRDWLYVEDHCKAIACVLERGRFGESYNIGGGCEKTNIDVVKLICSILDDLQPCKHGSYSNLIEFVKDRPGHDLRYAMNCNKIKTELGWKPEYNFSSGLASTVKWYTNNLTWVEHIQSGAYKDWISSNYSSR